MKIVGNRKETEIVFNASADKIIEGALFNDETQKILPPPRGFIVKGVYHFKTHEEANKHWEESLAKQVSAYGSKHLPPRNF